MIILNNEYSIVDVRKEVELPIVEDDRIQAELDRECAYYTKLNENQPIIGYRIA